MLKQTHVQVASLKKQIAGLSVQAEAARAQLQAHSISSQKRTSQFEQQKAALEVKTGLSSRPLSSFTS